NVCLHAAFHEFGDSAGWARGRAHDRARNFRETTDRASSLAHVFWVVYRHRFLLSGAATGISRLVARISCPLGPSPAAAGAADFLDDSSSFHESVQENGDATCGPCFVRGLALNLERRGPHFRRCVGSPTKTRQLLGSLMWNS